MMTKERLIQHLAVAGGITTLQYFRRVSIAYTKKSSVDVVSKADLAANKIIIGGIRKNFPDHDIVSEETGPGPGRSEYVWIVDPLDGSLNFVAKIPFFCTMLAFAKGNDVLLAAIYDPIHGDLCFAKKGGGAFLNNKRIHCSYTKHWRQSLGVGTGMMDPKKSAPQAMQLLMASALRTPFVMSIFGSIGISMMSVASGERDWAFSLSGGLWDYAPVSLILQEAGCLVSNRQGNPWKLGDQGMIAGNQHLQPKLLRLIKKAL
jgi:myo-inositol-1(or 4)-monophosphatase